MANKFLVGFFLLVSFSMAVLIIAFDSHFFDHYYYEEPMPSEGWGSSWTWNWQGGASNSWGNPLGRDAWATDMRDKSEDSWPDMWRGLKASIAFGAITSFFALLGVGGACSESKNLKRISGGLLILSLIGLLVSVAVWVGADKTQVGEVSFHQPRRDLVDWYRTNSVETPTHLKIWRNAYYGSIVCMTLSVFFGLIGAILLFK